MHRKTTYLLYWACFACFRLTLRLFAPVFRHPDSLSNGLRWRAAFYARGLPAIQPLPVDWTVPASAMAGKSRIPPVEPGDQTIRCKMHGHISHNERFADNFVCLFKA